MYFIFFFNIEGNSELNPYKQDIEEVFNIGKCYLMIKDLLYFLNLEKKQY